MAIFHTPRQLRRTAEFYRQLAALLAAGIPAVQAIQQIARHPPAAADRPRLLRATRHIESGCSLTEAFSVDRGWFAVFDLALLKAGEKSGRIVESSRTLADHYAGRAQLLERFITSLIYPAFLLHLAVVVFPPDLLPRLIWHGEVGFFLGQKLLVLAPLYGGALLLAFALQSRRALVWQAMVEQVLHLVPGLGPARRELALARLSAALEALISAGVNLIEAWGLAADASGSPALLRAVRQWEPRVVAGELPSDQVRQSREFPELFANLYFTGETSGQLDHELRHLHEFYLDSSSRRLTRFTVATGLVITLAVMGTVAFWIIRFWTGYFRQLSDVIGG
jgi:type II secretory pathway component PulF